MCIHYHTLLYTLTFLHTTHECIHDMWMRLVKDGRPECTRNCEQAVICMSHHHAYMSHHLMMVALNAPGTANKQGQFRNLARLGEDIKNAPIPAPCVSTVCGHFEVRWCDTVCMMMWHCLYDDVTLCVDTSRSENKNEKKWIKSANVHILMHIQGQNNHTRFL